MTRVSDVACDVERLAASQWAHEADGGGGSTFPRSTDLLTGNVTLFSDVRLAPGGGQANYSAGNTTSTPFFFRRITMNFAGSVVLALRPTVCTSLGPS